MKRLYLISLFLLMGACSQSTDNEPVPGSTESSSAMATTEPAPSATYEEAHAAAVAAIKLATEKAHAWTTSDSLLKQAQAAAEGGDVDRAIQLADDARVQGELAVKQADTEAAVWREKILSD